MTGVQNACEFPLHQESRREGLTRTYNCRVIFHPNGTLFLLLPHIHTTYERASTRVHVHRDVLGIGS